MINDEYRHTSMIATLRKVWDLGDAFTDRDAAAAPFDHLLSRDSPRDPASWPDFKPLPVPELQLDKVQMDKVLSTLGKTMAAGCSSTPNSPESRSQPSSPTPTDPQEQIITALRSIARRSSRALPLRRRSRTRSRSSTRLAGLRE